MNKAVFASAARRQAVPVADVVNEAGGQAYAFEPKHALAQLAVTGCLNNTFYATEEDQLKQVLELCEKVDPVFIAKCAVFCREKSYMKDMPALLVTYLAKKPDDNFRRAFCRVVDNGKMLRNFVQAIRSGTMGRKSLGHGPKMAVVRWLAERSDEQIFKDSVGNDPSMADVIKMVHPKPATDARRALYGYLLEKEHDFKKLPPLVRQFERFKKGETKEVPEVPFLMLTALPIGEEGWKAIAHDASWQATRMNLNTFLRHGVFEDKKLTKVIADRLRDPEQIKKARVFPYQLMIAYKTIKAEVPHEVREALQDAADAAVDNVPNLGDQQIYVLPDVSGSMQSPVTGVRRGATTAVSCVEVAALMSSAILRRNRSAEVLPFSTKVHHVELNPRDSLLTNAEKLSINGGGTACSVPLQHLNAKGAKGDLVVYISDNESWADTVDEGTATMQEWRAFKARNRKAKLVCIDLQAYGSTQAKEREDILNVGGFSDQVFNVLADFATGRLGAGHWVGEIEKIKLD